MAVGKRLKTLRIGNQVSMNKVHLETRMSTSYLTKLERDEFVPGTPNLEKIVTALKKLDVKDADVLLEEQRAVTRDRQMLDVLRKRLDTIDDAAQRRGLLEDFMQQLPS